MTDESVPKFSMPKARRDLSNLDELLAGVVASPVVASSKREAPNIELDSSALPTPEPVVAMSTTIRPERQRPQKETSRAMIKLIIEEELIMATKIRAVEKKTTAAAIVELALRNYFAN
jgi:hypothetical protein